LGEDTSKMDDVDLVFWTGTWEPCGGIRTYGLCSDDRPFPPIRSGITFSQNSLCSFVLSHRVDHPLRDRHLSAPPFIESPADPSPEVPSSAFMNRITWHLKDPAHVEGEVFESCKGAFGIPHYHSATPVRDSYDVPISNAIFLPPPGARLEDYYWDITGESAPPPVPEHRELWFHVTASGVTGLHRAETPLELCMVIGNSMLGRRRFPYTAFGPR